MMRIITFNTLILGDSSKHSFSSKQFTKWFAINKKILYRGLKNKTASPYKNTDH